jgi:hypothetical protein
MTRVPRPVDDVKAETGQRDIEHLDQFAALELAGNQDVAA